MLPRKVELLENEGEQDLGHSAANNNTSQANGHQNGEPGNNTQVNTNMGFFS